jgi:uncharacterized protein
MSTISLADLRDHWVLVTGSSAGIGRQFAVQLAAAGANLVLLARRKVLLDTLAAELEARYGIGTRTIDVDLASPGAVRHVRQSLSEQNIRIRLLINNAGMQSWRRFEDLTWDAHRAMLELNISVLAELCHALRPDLQSYHTSAVINLASPAAFQPVPFMAVYAASKAFVLSFSQALYGEWARHGILVQALIVGPTDTPGFEKLGIRERGPFRDFDAPCEVVVSKSLAQLEKGSPVVIVARGTWKQRLFSALFPPRMVIRIVSRMFNPTGRVPSQ